MLRCQVAHLFALMLFATSATACAAGNDDDALEGEEASSAQGQQAEGRDEDDTTKNAQPGRGEALPEVSESSTGLKTNNYSCPTWRCGFNGLEPSALLGVGRLGPSVRAR